MELKNIIDNIEDYKTIDRAMDFVIKNNIKVYSQTLLDLLRINFNIPNNVRHDYESTIISTIITNDILCRYNTMELLKNDLIMLNTTFRNHYPYKNLDYLDKTDFVNIKKYTYARIKDIQNTYISDAFILASRVRRDNLYMLTNSDMKLKLFDIMRKHQIKELRKLITFEQKEIVYEYTKVLLTKTVMNVYVWKAFFPIKFEGIYYLHNILKTLNSRELYKFFVNRDSYIYLDYIKKFDSFVGGYKGLLNINNYIKKES